MTKFGFINDDFVRSKLDKSEHRISRAFEELFSGYALTADDVLNDVVRVDGYPGIVTVKNISFYTFCEHHFLPFYGQASITYQPNQIVTGLGKIVRLVKDVHAKRLQIQEIMAKDIAEDIMRVLDAKGVRVELTATHLCMCARGPQDDTALTDVKFEMGSLLSI